MNQLISENDQHILNRYAAMIGAHMKASKDAGNQRQTTTEYRAMMLAINPYKFPPGYKPVAVTSFRPKLFLRQGLTASVSIPKGHGPFPIIIHAHGHGLRAGSPPEYEPWIRLMSSYGFVVMFPDYRWQPEVTFADQIDDMMFAIDWCRKNSTEINGDCERMILGGDSAGGGLAISVLMKTLADFNGPRFVAFESVDGAVGGGSGDPGQNAPNILSRVTPEMKFPPIIMSVGSADTGFAAQAATAALALGNARKNYDLHIYYGMPHDFMKFPQLDIMHRANNVMMTWLLGVV